jgi:hypothetical protein
MKLISSLLLLVAALMAITSTGLVGRDEEEYFEGYNGVGNPETAGGAREDGGRAPMNFESVIALRKPRRIPKTASARNVSGAQLRLQFRLRSNFGVKH